MMPHEPVLDMMRRTMANLEFIERHAKRDGPFEVTQLINSFLGALAHPWESLKNELNGIELAAAASRGWPKLEKEFSSDHSPSSLGDLLRLLRNGVAHGNLTFLPDGRGHIAALRIVNSNKDMQRTWGVIVTPEAMRSFLQHFVELAEELKRDALSPKRIA